MTMEIAMIAKNRYRIPYHLAMAILIVFGCFVILAPPSAVAAGQAATKPPVPIQKTFDKPEDAADALIQAASTDDLAALNSILGSHSADLVSQTDPVKDKSMSEAFAARANEKHSIQIDAANKNRAILIIGPEDWPMPIPLVKQNGKWLFDTKAGRQEIIDRRIGQNELDAIQICRGYVDAQEEYSLEKHDGSEVNQYAQKIISTPGKRDGLVWRNEDGTFGGPIAQPIADAIAEGYTRKDQPYHGYYFKILKSQGPAAPLGQMDFVVEGAMIGGFALAAAPAEYRVTGVKTFIVGFDGVVYEKDFGPNTLQNFRNMERFNPDKTWQVTDDQWPPDAFASSPAMENR